MKMVCNICKCTIRDVYGRGAIVETANDARRNLNSKGLRVFDLRANKDDGSHWGLPIAQHRNEAFEITQDEQPDWIIRPPMHLVLFYQSWAQLS